MDSSRPAGAYSVGMDALRKPDEGMDGNTEGNSSSHDKDVRLNWKKFALVGIIPIILIFAGFILGVKLIGRDNYDDVVMLIDQNFGLLGIFMYVYVVDTLILPLSPDFVFPVVAGMNPLVIIPLIGSASALGGVTSYGIGLLIHKIPVIKRLTDKATVRWGAYIRKYGTLFVLLSGILPLPFSTICSVAGAVKLPARKVLPCCLVRYLRTALYFAFFSLGLSAIA